VPLKVSVVVPVYNPGKYIDKCISSLLGQTLPDDEYEIIFVDDGSTDETPARLDKLAAEHGNVRVIHIPNSGWPGKPRNIGVSEARGEYVHFVDQDDHMAPDALRRLWEMGNRNGSDIVFGKVASNFRGVPHGVFRVNREKCTIYDAPLVDSLTPHKMFRAEFLRVHNITYPEDKRRLEDQLYMMKAYFPAKVVSILGDYTCYYYSKRDDGKNAGSAKIVPPGYYGNLREVLDIVVANTKPGEFRDGLLRRFCRVEMLGRLSEPSVLKYDPAYLNEMVDAVKSLADDYMTDGVVDGFGAILRIRSTLLRRDQRDGLVEIARRAASVKGHARLEDFAWENGRIALGVSVRLVYGDDNAPLALLRRGDRFYLHPDFHRGVLSDDELVEVTDELGNFKTEMSIRDREAAVQWPCLAKFEAKTEELDSGGEQDGVHCHVVLRGTAHLDPKKTRHRETLNKGIWDVWVQISGLGLVRRARLGADRAAHVAERMLPALLGRPAQLTIPYFTDPGDNLSLDVNRRGKRLGDALANREVLRMPETKGRPLEVELATVSARSTSQAQAWLVLRGKGDRAGSVTLPAVLEPVGGRTHLRLDDISYDSSPFTGLRPGTWQLSARLDGRNAGPELKISQVIVDRRGRLRLTNELNGVDADTARVAADERRRSARRRVLRQIGGPMIRRLKPSTRKKLRRIAAKYGA
jgi:glycosyltransferase involved in cell wall biosynthesis